MDPLTSSYDVSLTWTRADVDVFAWLLTWSDDVIRHQQQISARGRSVRVHRRVEEKAETQWRVEARATSYDRQIFRPSRSVHVEACRAARVPIRRSDVRNLRRRVGDFPKLSSARGGAWLAFC